MTQERSTPSKPKGSYAVMAQNRTAPDSLSYFPTPLWGTRALTKYVIPYDFSGQTAWEPACGGGHMATALAESFGNVFASDMFDYGAPGQDATADFLDTTLGSWQPPQRPDWIITNPPFNAAIGFARTALERAERGVALLCRVQWLEGRQRERLFNDHPLTFYAPFMGRLPMVKGRLDPRASTATAYAWFVWHKNPDVFANRNPIIRAIPTTAKLELDRPGDWR